MSSEPLVDSLADTLVEQGYVVVSDALPDALQRGLLEEARGLWSGDAFRAAGIGNKAKKMLAADIRSDQIHWWPDHAESDVQSAYHEFLEELRIAINRRTFMGLFDWEGHYAHYQEATFYRRHLDVFKDSPSRKLSVITYLNEDWTPADGGCLRLYTAGKDFSQFIDIEPKMGTVVVFEAERFYHEVLDSSSSRYSITGWFRVRSA